MQLDLLGTFSKKEMGDGFALSMMERAMVFQELPIAAKSMGFKLKGTGW
jgi:hypothetical protein